MIPPSKGRRVLVIKLGALGDFVLATGAFADLRAHEADSEITLLTTPALAEIAGAAPWFDRIEVDRRLPLWRIGYVAELMRRLRRGRYDIVYDLQGNRRTGRYWRLMGRPAWNGIVVGCSHPHTNANRHHMHGFDILRDQMGEIGVASTHEPDLSWAGEPLGQAENDALAAAAGRTVALLPGSAPSRPEKRWPGFGDLARLVTADGDTPILVGAGAEADLLHEIEAATGALNLCGRLSVRQLVTLFTRVDCVVGNDTGPMHIAGAARALGLTILGPASDPNRHAPPSLKIARLQSPDLASLDAAAVWERVVADLNAAQSG
jgi:ADP-heptose:LPS heptosyltransferase